MAQNKITDLRNHLFAQMERLGEEGLTEKKLQAEVDRAKAIADVARVIVDSAKVEVEYLKLSGRDIKDSEFLLPIIKKISA